MGKHTNDALAMWSNFSSKQLCYLDLGVVLSTYAWTMKVCESKKNFHKQQSPAFSGKSTRRSAKDGGRSEATICNASVDVAFS
ncbi:hypothetical protein TcWFU_006906 [Taenia crassiceps]|uniref:Uncharacterized protein n=1 Tax=Taenia crassiceps TaxID=6207 RepID=A0ABR4QB87_9CEST